MAKDKRKSASIKRDRAPYVEDKSLRKIVLKIFERDGDPEDVLYCCHRGQERKLFYITRGRFFEFFDIVAKNKTLSDAIVRRFVEEAVNYLDGADDPLYRGDPSLGTLQDIFPSSDKTEAHILSHDIFNRLADSLFFHSASEEDWRKIHPFEVKIVDTA